MILLGCGYKDASHFGLALVFLRLNLLFVDYRIESEESFLLGSISLQLLLHSSVTYFVKVYIRERGCDKNLYLSSG